ncbi:hypothetical protein EGW08_020498 [Elysia chlorotica]|uniref:Sulfatase N-terminal domain-containing protein n=1 Tax=Elysia chlorotica TaxID=188477 RepID=A0A3S1BPJ3_ELYCH|nr:hypothetical protein EGW08_020498 [Elysia chlorotica]
MVERPCHKRETMMDKIVMHARNKPTVLVLTILLAVTGVQCRRRRPNIVFILTDDQGYNDIGYRGSEFPTPNLDALAEAGVKLENYYVQPICSPSRSQLMSGKYQIHTGLQHDVIGTCEPRGLPLGSPTMPDILQEQGYATHAIGKWHLGFFKEEYTPLRRGFDTFFGILPSGSFHYSYKACAKAEVNGSINVYCGYSLRDMDTPYLSGNGTYSTHLYTQKAVQRIQEAADSDKPMFLYLAYTAPHFPLEAPEEYYRDFTNIANFDRKVFAGMMSTVDEGVKNITDALKSYGLWDNTILIYSSDNGGEPSYGGSNWPLRGTKSTLWEGGLKTVGFVNSPLIRPHRRGKISNELMHISDWFPTISAMAGISLKRSLDLDGVNQWPMIRGGKPGRRTELLHNIDIAAPMQGSPLFNDTFDTRIRAALRVGKYKLLTGNPGNGTWYPRTTPAEGFGKSNRWQAFDSNAKNVWLYNVARDPRETTDLSDAMPGKVREMLDRLAMYNATALAPWNPAADPNCDPDQHGGIWEPWL